MIVFENSIRRPFVQLDATTAHAAARAIVNGAHPKRSHRLLDAAFTSDASASTTTRTQVTQRSA
jgi:hypothetical protein